MKRIAGFDGLRAVAVLAVLGHHGLYGRLPGGILGVDLFFVLSGYLITTLLLEEERANGRVSLRNFYARRALRILPPIPIALALALAFTSTPWSAVIPPIIFVANYVPDLHALGALAHTWSLSVEEHFYLLWPIVFVALPTRRREVLAAVVLGIILLRFALFPVAPVEDIHRWSHTRMDSLAIGCLAAVTTWRQPAAAGIIVFVCLLVGFLVVQVNNAFVLTLGFTFFALLCAILIKDPPAIMEWRVLRFIGKRSYGIYLFHLPVFVASESFRRPHDPLNFLIVKAAAVAVTIAIADLSYRTVERYALSFRDRFR